MAKYREIVIRGDSKLMKGFLAGYRATANVKSGLMMAREHRINTHHLREILKFRGGQLHLLVRTDVYKAARSVMRRVMDDLEFEVVSDRAIRRAWFKYEFETLNRKAATRIKRLLSNLPEGLSRKGPSPKEKIDPRSKGVEVYAPSPEYSYRGTGEISGDLERLLSYHRKLRDNEFIHVEDIELEH